MCRRARVRVCDGCVRRRVAAALAARAPVPRAHSLRHRGPARSAASSSDRLTPAHALTPPRTHRHSGRPTRPPIQKTESLHCVLDRFCTYAIGLRLLYRRNWLLPDKFSSKVILIFLFKYTKISDERLSFKNFVLLFQ